MDMGFNAGSQVLRARGNETRTTYLVRSMLNRTRTYRLCGDTQIKGDSPELVEYVGMKNLINAVKDGVGLENGKLIFGVGGKFSQVTSLGF